MIFIIGWHARRYAVINNTSILSATFLGVALLNLGHVIFYPGMPAFFGDHNGDRSLWFWLALRAFGGAGVMATAFRSWRPLRLRRGLSLLLAGVLLWVVLCYWVILWHSDGLPPLYIFGQGQSRVKVTAELVLSLPYFCAAIAFWRGAKRPNAALLGAACWMLGLAGIFYSMLHMASGIYSMIAHLHVVLAYSLLYQALFIKTIRDPYIRLQQVQDHLEGRVAERTKELRVALQSLKSQQRDLERAKHVADSANAAKSEFLSAMSHELRTPLNAIIGFAQLLHTEHPGPLSDKQKGYLDHIIDGGRHLVELINDILDVARIETGRLMLSLEGIDPRGPMAECYAFATGYARGFRVHVSDWQYDASLPSILVDYTRFKQVLLNLISNAIKYNCVDGTVTLTASRWGQETVRFAVTDSGPGIPKHKQNELFMPFNRLGAETSEIEGTGVGLTITKQLVEAMGGAIGYSCDDGRGCTFWVDFPMAESIVPSAPPVETAEPGPAASLPKALRMLYVEDNPANVQLMEAFLEEMDGITLQCTNTMGEGLALVESGRPDLVVLDINLPDMSGLQGVRQLRALPALKDLPVIALSANVMPAAVQQGLAAGFDYYLTKPLNFKEFFRIVEELTKRQETE